MSLDVRPEEPPGWQYEAHNECFYNLCDLKFSLEDEEFKNTATLTREQLASLSVYVLDDLNVDDDETPLDFAPLLFAPLPKNTLDKFLETYPQYLEPRLHDDGSGYDWRTSCGANPVIHCKSECNEKDGDQDESDHNGVDTDNFGWTIKRHCFPEGEARFRSEWVLYMYKERFPGPYGEGQGMSVLANWIPMRKKSYHTSHWNYRGHRDFPCRHEECGWHRLCCESTDAHEDMTGLMPHVTSIMTEPSVFGATDVLPGDILASVALMRHQVRYHKHVRHRIFPVLLLSFQHDKVARIIQMHFDGHCLFIRQSRPLDLNSDKPTADANILLRWMASQPRGDTEYTAPVCTNEVPMALGTKDPEQPSAAVAVRS